MDNETTGKDTAITGRSKPTLVTLGNRLVPSDGKFHPDLAAEYVLTHGGREHWIPLGELARVFYMSNTPINKMRVRQRLWRIFHALLKRGHILVTDNDAKTGAAVACKLYEPRSVEEQQSLNARLERMQRQKLLKTDQYEQALALAVCLNQTAQAR